MTTSQSYRWSHSLRAILPALMLVIHSGYSQSTSHTVTVQVNQIALLQTAGSVSASIGGAGIIAGNAELSASDQMTTLLWATNRGTQKITARLSAATAFQIYLQALNPTSGVASPEILVDTAPKDLLLSVGRSQGSATLSYRVKITADKGVLSNAPQIYFEMINQ